MPLTSWTAISDPPSPYERMTSTTLGNFVNFVLPTGTPSLCACLVGKWVEEGYTGPDNGD